MAWNLSSHAQGVNSTAFVQTVAGGGTAAATGKAISLNIGAHGKVVFDTVGNFYIPDFGNSRVIKVDLAGNSTIVATGAPFTDLTFDTTNNILYAAGYSSGSIFRVDLNTNTQTALISPGGLPVGVALSPDGTKLYYSIQAQCSWYRLDLPSTTPTLIAGDGNCTAPFVTNGSGATSASFHTSNEGVIADNNGNVYIADANDNRIWHINAAGIANVVAGNGIAGSAGDGGPATAANLNFPDFMVLDANGDLIFSDRNNTAIRKVALSTGILTTLTGGLATTTSSANGEPFATTNFNNTSGLGIDAAGYYYVNTGGLIRRFAPFPITMGKTVTNAPPEGVSGSFGLGISCNDGSSNPGTLTLGNQATNSQLLQYMPSLGATCTVAESTPLPAAPAYHEWTGVPSYSVDGGAPTAQLNNLLIDSTGHSVMVTNNLLRQTSTLNVTKLIAPSTVTAAGDFGFAVNCQTPVGSYTGTVTVATGNTASSAISVPAGSTNCQVSETSKATPPQGYQWIDPVYQQPPADPLQSGATVNASITNTLRAATATLNVTKLITPSEVAVVGEFGFVVSCQTPSGSYPGTVAVTTGNTGTSAINVPAGSTNCQVSETSKAPAPQGYQWNDDPVYQQPSAGPLQDGVAVSASITNTLRANSSASAAPVPVLSLPGLLALGVLMAGVAGWGRRRNLQ